MVDGKEQYRKPPFAQKFFEPCQDPASLANLRQYERLCSEYPDAEYFDMWSKLVEVGHQGANLFVMTDGLSNPFQAWLTKTGKMSLFSDYTECAKEQLKKEKAIRNALKLLGDLEPAFEGLPDSNKINHDIEQFKNTIQNFQNNLLEEYFHLALIESCLEVICRDTLCNVTLDDWNYYKQHDPTGGSMQLKEVLAFATPEKLRKWTSKQSKPLQSSTHNVWSEGMATVDKELQRIGYSANTAKKITAELFKIRFPEVFKQDNIEDVMSKVGSATQYLKNKRQTS